MLNDIFLAIDKKAQEEIGKAEKEKEAALLVMEKEHQKELKKRKAEEKELLQRKAESELEELKQKKDLRRAFRLQEEKNKLVKMVYEKALKKMSELPEVEFEKVISELFRFVPENLKGKIVAGKRTAGVLRKIVSSDGQIEEGLPEEGFICQSQDMEIDVRFSQVAKQLKEKTDPKVIEILFT